MNRSAPGTPTGETTRLRVPGEAIERISDAFLALDREWRYTYVNAQAGLLFGRRPEDLVGKHIWTEFPESVGREFHLAYNKAMTEQQPVFLEEYYQPLDLWFENRIYPSAEGLTVYLHDITERKKDEALLSGQSVVLEKIAAGTPLTETLAALVRLIEARSSEMLCTVLLLDEDGRHLRHGAAPSVPEIYARAIDGAAIGPRAGTCGTAAFRREAVIVEDIATDALWQDYPDFSALALANGLRACWSTPIFDASHRVLGTFAIYYREAGRPSASHQRLIEIATHIAAVAISHERAQASLRLSESRHRTLFEYAPDGIVIADQESRYLAANASICQMLGYTREELIGRYASDIVVPEEIPHIATALDAIKAKADYHREWQFRRKDGSVFAAEVMVTTMPDGNLLGMIRDIAARKRAEAALRESEGRFRQVVENIREVFWMTDPAKNAMLYVSPSYEAIWGRTCESLYRTPRNWVEAIHPDDRERVLAAAVTQQSGDTYDETYRIVRPDGSLRWVRDRAYPIYNAEGNVYRIVGTAEDISSQKEMELQVMRMQRVESVGRMASGIAHDLNNILAPILMGAPLLRMNLSAEQVGKTLSTIEASAQRGADLVKQLLMFCRGVEGRRMLVCLDDLVREMEEFVRETFPRNIVITTEAPDEIWPVMGDSAQLHQVMLNLCVNARDAMPQGGTLTIVAKNIRIDETYASVSPEARPGDYVCVTVTDTGTGMPPAVLEKIFDPFFTTKEVGKGTGLGLSTLITIVKSHAGFVTVRSEVGRGSSFQIHLPAEPETKGAPRKADAAELPRGHGETILLVDDEASIRQITSKILEQYGYRVLSSDNGADACAEFARHLTEIEIVLTDIDMPVMGGVNLIEVLKRMKPTIKVIVSSGRASEQSEMRSELKALQARILTKPYTAEKILNVIHELITNAPRSHRYSDTSSPFPT